MKMKKMIGAFALTAALAMGTAPAFATGTVDTAAGNNEFSDTGSTEIKAKVDNVDPNVRASVPLKVVVVMGATGGTQILGPSADAYKITNIGDGPIKLTNAELTDMNSAFTSDIVIYDGSDYMDQNGDPFGTGDHIMFTFQTPNNCAYLTTAHAAKDQKAIGTDKDALGTLTAKKWADETMTNKNDSVAITLGGNAFFNSTLDSGEQTDTLCKIKYTIASAS